MSDIAVIYESRYGFTETYARWIAEELSADLLEAGRVKAADLQQYGAIIFGGGLYAGGVGKISLITKNFHSLEGKALYLFTVGVTDVAAAENVASIRSSLARVLTPPMLDKIKLYHFRGGLKYSKMSLFHRAMMAMMRRILLKKPESERSDNDRGILDTYGRDVDYTDRQMIAPLVADVMRQNKMK